MSESNVIADEGIVQVMREIGKDVSDVDNLTLEAGRWCHGELAEGHRLVERCCVPRDAFTCRPREVQASEVDERCLELIHNLQRVNVCIPPLAPMFTQRLAQCTLSCMPERRMSEIVCQGDRLAKRLVSREEQCESAGNLRNLEHVIQTRAIHTPVTLTHEALYLRLVLELPECARMDDPVAIDFV